MKPPRTESKLDRFIEFVEIVRELTPAERKELLKEAEAKFGSDRQEAAT